MPSFAYRARASSGIESGKLDAADRPSALRILKGRGLHPLALDEVRSSKSSAEKTPKRPASENSAKSRWKKTAPASARPDSTATNATSAAPGALRLKRKELLLFTEQLAEMLKAGLQLEPALRALAERSAKGNLGPVAGKLREALRDGSSFSTALAATSPSFSPLYRALSAAGEAAGSLPSVLQRQADHLEAMADLRQRVIMALIYPCILLLVGLLVITLFVTYLVPMLTELLSGGRSIPPGAQALIGVSNFIRTGLPWIVVMGLVLAAVAWVWRKNPANRQRWDRAMLNLPLLGPLTRNSFASQFAQTLATVTSGGLPLLRGLVLTRDATSNFWFRQRLELASQRVAEGADLSRALQDTTEIPPLLLDIIRLGERTGNLPQALDRAGHSFQKELAASVARITALVAPTLVIGIAIPVGAIAYLMVTAIFDTMSGING